MRIDVELEQLAHLGVLGALVRLGLSKELLEMSLVNANTAVREAAFERRWQVLRIFAIAVAVQMLLLPGLIAEGVPVTRIGLYPLSEIVGGLIFGCGMALAGGCVTGILWRSGTGSVAAGLAVVSFGAGELLIRHSGRGAMRWLDTAGGHSSTSTLQGVVHVRYAPLALGLGAVTLLALLAWSRRGAVWGAGLGLLGAAAWVVADWVGYGYGLGFVGTASAVQHSLERGGLDSLSFQVYLALGVIAGASLAAHGAIRVPSPARAGRAVAGGVLMGVGGNVAHACNIGHGLTGIPLLSLGSMLATASMAVGVIATWLLLRTSPALRGREHRRVRDPRPRQSPRRGRPRSEP